MADAWMFQRGDSDSRSESLAQYPYLNCFVVWLTGLSGSGKSTIASALQAELSRRLIPSLVLDGDQVRQGLSRDLGFSMEERAENIRRVGEVAKLLQDAGLVVIVSAISPRQADRVRVRDSIGERFIEVFVDCPLAVCEQRDTKGLYRKAREGKLHNLTGIGSPYEIPENPEVVLKTDRLSLAESIEQLISYLEQRQLV
ncbi:adenylyl-sulfate kinase [Xylanibacillus composti]|nr:adenylyl-sulfate kinase [Xylanibacillus composti]